MNKTFKIQPASTDQCTGCAACASICPTNSITMREDKEGFLQPHIDINTCIKCHKCEKTCPIIKPIDIPTDFETQAYAAINKDEAVRMRSSSGGMFYALAKWTIEQGGVVFGARFEENWDVVHDYTETIEGIEPFMRSKYVQSHIGDTFKQAKQFLKEGRQVLFVGTPCQIGGLHAYLGKDYENLVSVDFICHGIPSPWVWKRYLQENFAQSELTYYNFRDKSEGWMSKQCMIDIKTKSEHRKTKLLDNPYFRGFRKDIYLRRSCYKCDFRTYNRLSDFTIADFWGVMRVCLEMFDNRGTSIVIIHSAKAKNILSHISSEIILKEQTKENAISGNRGMDSENPIWSPFKRKLFYTTIQRSTFQNAMILVDRFLNTEEWLKNQSQRVQRKLKKIFR